MQSLANLNSESLKGLAMNSLSDDNLLSTMGRSSFSVPPSNGSFSLCSMCNIDHTSREIRFGPILCKSDA